MIIDKQHKAAFAEYEEPLRQLENAFNLAGLPVSFRCFVDPLNNQMVDVTNKNKTRNNLICIEADSPAQAIKDVAARVKL